MGRVPVRTQTSSPSRPLFLSPGGSQVLRKVVTTPQSPTHPSTPTALPQPLKPAPQALGAVLCQNSPANSKLSQKIQPGSAQAPPPRASLGLK